MSKKFVVIHEAIADFRTATEIADRVLVACIDWIDDSLLESQRTWLAESPLGSPLTWKSIPGRARDAGIRAHGHFASEPGLADAHAARRAIAYVLREVGNVEAIVLIRDADDQPERRNGLEQARRIYASERPIIVGVAVCEREAWVVSGFTPSGETEAKALADECRKLGFNPCLRSDELTAGKDDTALRSPKRVLKALSGDDRDREAECWRSAALTQLLERGERNGLRDYIEEVRTRLAPVISGVGGSFAELGVEEAGPPLGSSAEQCDTAVRYSILPGDVLVIYTDGIREANNKSGTLFGALRARAAVRGAGNDPASVGQAVLTAVERFCEGAPQSDDICLICFGRDAK